MWPFKKKEDTARIRELEITLRILSASILVKSNRPSGLHARDNKLFSQYVRTVDELEKLSADWRKKGCIKQEVKMKFEKFFKSASIYGQVISRGYKKWLVCGGVGMVVPDGLCANLSKGADSGKAKMIVDALCETFDQEPVMLSRAYLAKDGKPSEVLRIFRDEAGNEVAITNKDFGLLERSDIALYWVDIEDDTDEDKEPQTLRFLIVQDTDDNVIGFILGINPNGLF